MSLTDKIKNTGKRLALVGMLTSPLYTSGCAALILGIAIKSHGDAQAEAIRDAARIKNGDENYNNQIPLMEKDRFFVCNDYTDLNNDGFLDMSRELVGEKNTFSTGEKINFLASFPNGKGCYINFKLYNLDSDIKKELKNSDFLLDKNNLFVNVGYPKGLSKGNYIGFWKVNGEKVGNKVIEVK